MMDTLRQWIPARQSRSKVLGQSLDSADLQGQPPVGYSVGERTRLLQQVGGAVGEGSDGLQQRRRGARCGKSLDGGAMHRQGIERNVDPVECTEILAAILQMIDHLQSRA